MFLVVSHRDVSDVRSALGRPFGATLPCECNPVVEFYFKYLLQKH